MIFKREHEGFSLIEVIIAMAILAILSMPILAYFSNAMVSTSQGRDTHKASMVAQSVVEELNSCATFEQIEDKLKTVSGGAWTVVTAYNDSTGKTELSKDVTEDGTDYTARVTVDYKSYADAPATTDGPEAKYNDYKMPQLKEVYADTNVVIAETDQTETAVSDFLYQLYVQKKSVTEADVKKDMRRELHLNVEKEAGGDIYHVVGSYKYSYTGVDKFEAVVEDVRIEKEKLANIYFFYNLLQTNEAETAVVDFDDSITSEEAKMLNIYFVCQKPEEKGSEYRLDFIKGNGFASSAKYHTNGIAIDKLPENISGIVEYDKNGKRIAHITVDVYAKGTTVSDDSTPIARVETSKGE